MIRLSIKKRNLLLVLVLCLYLPCRAQEKIFAGYFDIAIGSAKNTEVIGRLHLERNKDVLTNAIPKTYKFVVTDAGDGLFHVETRRDDQGRIMGVLLANKKIDPEMAGLHPLTISLIDGSKTLNKVPITIKVVKQTLWQTYYERYKDRTVSTQGERMYGRKTPSDKQVEEAIEELEKNNGKFSNANIYIKDVTNYKSPDHKTIEFEWESIANKIGGLGWAYAKSKKYGPGGQPDARERLKRVLYNAIIAYTECVPVEGKDVIIQGKPIGSFTGDGFSKLENNKLIDVEVATHQWLITDPLIAPAVQLAPDMQADIAKGDKQATDAYYDLVRIFQTAWAVLTERRAIDDPENRWGKLTDTLRSSGAWADANLGHRSRMILALPVIWADYNRPITYVQYWYSDFYKDKPFKDFSFSPGWSPHGVFFDAARWMTKNNVPAHKYRQSGFQPDGTVSHHIANATDAAMVAYGFEWLTDVFIGFNQYKNTDLQLADKNYQFPADRLEKVYPKIIYNGRFDFLVSGRSYDSDLKKFVSNVYLKAIRDLQASESHNTKITNQKALEQLHNTIGNNSYQYSGTTPFWINDFLVHRRGKNEKPFYVSVKLKSKRTVGAEDFAQIRKAWFMGYGVLPLKITGDEYSDKVLANFDWHAMPGVTEEWRTDAIPTGHAQASLPGDNLISNVTSDGKSGMAIYHHLPRETYSSTTAYKTYNFIDNKIIALGTNIRRLRPGQQQDIITTLDQSAFINKLTISQNGKTELIDPAQSVALEYTIKSPTWLHIGEKGYIIYPDGEQKLIIKTGNNINITDKEAANSTSNYIIALDHGKDPDKAANYCYFLVPNVTAAEMPALIEKYQNDVEIKKEPDAHAVYSKVDRVWQAAFFKPSAITIGGIKIQSDVPAQVMLTSNGNGWVITMSNPIPSMEKQQLAVHLSIALKPGKYEYQLGGVYPRKGEFVTVTSEGTGSKLVAELPDARDEAFYNYQAELYNAAPIVINIPK